MAKNFIDECKTWLPKFYSNGTWNDKPPIKFNGRYAEDEVVEFMSDLFHFMIESDFLNKTTILWLNSNMPSVKRAIEAYNNEVDEVDMININTAQSAINFSKGRISKYFDTNLFFNILTYPENNLAGYRKTLDYLIREYFSDKEYKSALGIRIDKQYISKELDSEDWNRFIKTMKVYSKEYINKIENFETDSLTRDMAGYYNYIISNKRLSKTDKERLEQLNKLFNIGK